MDGLWPELRDALAAKRDVVGAIRRVSAPDGELAVEIGNPDHDFVADYTAAKA